MLLVHEKSFSRGTVLEVRLQSDFRYRLAFGALLVYENDTKSLRGKVQPYRFRSVEQLRYDFEQDVKSLGGDLG